MMDPLDISNAAAKMSQHFDAQRKYQERLTGRHDAAEIFDHLMRRGRSFQNSIPGEYEVGVQLANFGIAAQIHIRAMSFVNPNLIDFAGVLADGQKVALVQHISQLNFLLTAVAPLQEEEPYRIGFGR